MPDQSDRTIKDILAEAREAEASENIKTAVGLYKEVISADEVNEDAYNRLMMILRKQKKYKDELRIIKQGIKKFEDFYASKIPKKSKAITALSNKLNKSFGLADRKGNSLYDPEPIARWKKRKLAVEKKIK